MGQLAHRLGKTQQTRATLVDILGVAIHVEQLADEIENKGITNGVLHVEVERRLKEAGLTVFNAAVEPPAGNPTLYLDVTAVMDIGIDQISYSIRLEDPLTSHMYTSLPVASDIRRTFRS